MELGPTSASPVPVKSFLPLAEFGKMANKAENRIVRRGNYRP
jgi:hypothetical protein